MSKTKHKNINLINKSGFTLIEAMVVIFIFSLIAFTFYRTYTIGTRYIIDSKNRLSAISVANEKMEIIRNLDYNDIGTDTGAIEGNIPETENIFENNVHYLVEIRVEYVDDPLDGTIDGGSDPVPTDYKKVSVKVSWPNSHVELVSQFVPKDVEIANPDEGILQINVFSDQPGGTGIPNSTVHVINSDTGLNTTVETNSAGNVILMGSRIKDSINKYEITLTKSDYETVNTLPPYPDTAYNPIDVHASVVSGSMNVANIVQNKLATLKVSTVDYLGNSIPGIGFHIEGGRKMGTEVEFPFAAVYNLDEDEATNSSGEKDFGSVSPGQYVLTLLDSVSNYVLIDTDPISPATLFSEQNLNLKARLADKNQTALLLRVVSSVDGVTPVEGAQVEISNGSGYSKTQTTSATGTVFFPTDSDAFAVGNYNLKIIAEGFSEKNSEIEINEDELRQEMIILESL